MTQHRYAGYTLMALLVEVNSVFLHVRQLMIMGKISKNAAVYRINNSFNLGNFILKITITYILLSAKSQFDNYDFLYFQVPL